MSNRSGSPYSTPRDANRVPLLVAASTADGITPVVLEADPTTHLLQVSSSGGAGTQYTELATTSPGTGTLSLGRYKSSAPTLTDGQLYGLQLDVNGNLKTTSSGGGGGLSVTDQATWTAGTSSFTPTGGVYNDSAAPLVSGQQGEVRLTPDRRLKVDTNDTVAGIGQINNSQIGGEDVAVTAPGTALVSIAGPTGDAIDTTKDSLNTFVTGGNLSIASQAPPYDINQSGNINKTDGFVAVAINGVGGVSFQVTGTWVGTLNLEGTVDGTNWSAVISTLAGFATAASTTFTINGLYRMVAPAGLTQVRLRMNPYTSGTAFVKFNVSVQSNTQSVFQGSAASLNAQVVGNIANAGTDSDNPVKVGGRYNTTRPTYTDGQRGDLQIGTRGSVGVSLFSADTTVSIAAAADTIDAATTSGTANKLVNISRGTVFNGTTWDRTPGTTKGAYSLIQDAAGNARGANVSAGNALLVDASAASSATIINNAQVSGSDIATTTDGIQLISIAGPTGDPVDTTGNSLNVNVINNGNILNTSGIAPNQNSILIAGSYREITGLSAGLLNAFLVPATDVNNYKSWSLQITGTWNGEFTFEGSNDNNNWLSIQAVNMNSSTSTQTTTTTSNNSIFSGTFGYRYFRVRMDSYSSGLATGVLELYTIPNPNHYSGVGAAQYGNWSISQLGPGNSNINTYSVHITTNTTTTPTSSTAYISTISISSEVAGTTSTVTIQDKQGTPLKLVNGFSTTSLTTTPTTINFQTPVKMVSGIDIITAGAVAATVDVWVNYYQ